MKTKSGKKRKVSKWHHWVIVCKKGRLVAFVDGRVFNGSLEAWIRSQK
jgi:hypothetical protein